MAEYEQPHDDLSGGPFVAPPGYEPALTPPPAEYQPTLTPPPAEYVSPVDQVLALGDQRSALDTKRTERVRPAMWLLPIGFGVLGGLVGWLATRADAPRAARKMLVLGVVISLASGLLGTLAMGGLGSMLGAGSGAASAWPASATGKPAFYYFGTAT